MSGVSKHPLLKLNKPGAEHGGQKTFFLCCAAIVDQFGKKLQFIADMVGWDGRIFDVKSLLSVPVSGFFSCWTLQRTITIHID